MKIAVYGTGGVGGYFGGRLAQAGADVHLIARGTHLEALQRDGLRVKSVRGDFTADVPVTDNPTDIGPCDFVLFTVKSFDTEDAARELHPLLDEETAVISLQNGLDNEEKLATEIDPEHVMGGVAYIFSTISEPGVIEHTGGPTSVTIGELDGERSDRAERFLELCDRTDGIEAKLSTAILIDLWKKAAFICAHAGMTAAVRLPVGEIRNQPESWDMYRRLIDEVCSVGRATGIELPDGTVSEWMGFADGLEAASYSSLHYDMTHGKPMELEALHGAIVRRGRTNDIPVPMTEAVYAILKPWAQRNKQSPE
jgi:2-dehydropantoate 2-reductase